MAEPVVLIPDLMCDARVFQHQINALSAECVVVIAAPVRGERVEEMASLMLDGLPARFALAGMGLGGVVATEIMRRAPERVNRLALISVEPQADTPAIAAERDLMIARARAGRLNDVMAHATPLEALAATPQRMDVQAQLLEMAQDLGPEIFVRQQRALQRRREYQATLHQIKVPAMVLGGAVDPNLPQKRLMFMSQLIPNAQLRMIEGAGRCAVLENPVGTTEALADWMAQPLVLG